MVSCKIFAAVLFLGLVTVGQFPMTFGSSMMMDLARGEGEHCNGACTCNVISIACCKADNNSCCGNIASDISILQCTGIVPENIVAGVLGLGAVAEVCSKSGMCSQGACILDVTKLINEGNDKSAYYCCTGVDTKNKAFVCKNSEDKDVLLQCAQKGNNSSRNATIVRGDDKPETVTTQCCTASSCNTSSSGR